MNTFSQPQAQFRHEYKYPVSRADYLAIRSRIRTVCQTDPHTGPDGTYQIRSIYFDNYTDKALREKIDGDPIREKFRIRYYNDDFSFITLEKKMKVNDLCLKYDARITKQECEALLDGQTGWMLSHKEQSVLDLYVRMRTQLLRPRVLVSYRREPYIYGPGHVRVTFDSRVRSTLYHGRFLEAHPLDVDVGGEEGQMILEVKYDAYLPSIIAQLIQIPGCRQESFSKYAASRRYG